MKLSQYIRDIQDFPKPGITFKDITPLLANKAAFAKAVSELANLVDDQPIDIVVGIEARGYFFGTTLAQRLNAGFVPVRKPGKLPYDTLSKTYALEYGEDTLEIHRDAIRPGDRVLLHDDVLATGGTAAAVIWLIEQLGGEIVQCNFLAEIAELQGRKILQPYPTCSLLNF